MILKLRYGIYYKINDSEECEKYLRDKTISIEIERTTIRGIHLLPPGVRI